MSKLIGYVAAGICSVGAGFALVPQEAGRDASVPQPAQVAPLKMAPFTHTNHRNRCAPMDRSVQAVPDRLGGTRCL